MSWVLQEATTSAADWTSLASVHLDPRLRNWVLIPIFIVMCSQGVLRHYMSMVTKEDKKAQIAAVQQSELIRRSQRLRGNYQFITPAAFRMRKQYFTQKAFKADKAKAEAKAAEAPPQDPLAAVGMMKQNVVMIVSNMLMMGWINYFFFGFVCVKLPFPLTEQFKTMLQRGVQLKSLESSYVSSLSWYFLILFGQSGLMSLILGSNNQAMNDARMMEQQMQMGGMGMQAQQTDNTKLFTEEREEIEIIQHDLVISDAEYRLLGQTPPTSK